MSHVDDLLDKMIKIAVSTYEVNPNKVNCMGYSAGGDGLYRLSCRMADRWSCACPWAGHPGDANAENLKNTTVYICTGGEDKAYNRNGLAEDW